MPQDLFKEIPNFDEDRMYLLSGSVLNEFKRVMRMLQVVPDDTFTSRQTEDGLMLGVNTPKMSALVDFPWRMKSAGADEEAAGIYFTAAQVHSDGDTVVADIGGTSLVSTPPPVLLVPASGTYQIYVQLYVSLNVVDDFVLGGEVSRAQLLYGSSLPTDDGETNFYYLIGSVTNGVPINTARTNMQTKFCDNGDAEGIGVMTVGCAP